LGIKVSAKIISDVARDLGVQGDEASCYVYDFHVVTVRDSDGCEVAKPAKRHYYSPRVFPLIEEGVSRRPVSLKQLSRKAKERDS
jgi:hypothetical protein